VARVASQILPQLQAFLDQARQARALPRRECLGLGEKLIVEIH